MVCKKEVHDDHDDDASGGSDGQGLMQLKQSLVCFSKREMIVKWLGLHWGGGRVQKREPTA